MVDRRTRRRAEKTLERIRKMRAEWTQWKGETCKLVRVNHGDYLALVECGYVRNGKLSGDDLEVKAA